MRGLLALVLMLLVSGAALAAPWEASLPAYEKENLARNRRWIAERRQAGQDGAQVGVVAGVGVWHPGARALVESLERSGVRCRVLDPEDLSGLDGLAGLILPGGFAPFQWYALGPDGLARVNRYVENGGHCLGICAGAYLMSKTVRYAGVNYPYPTQMFDGVAEGPVAGLPVYPQAGPVALQATETGRKLGLSSLVALYGGGPRFLGGTGATVLLTYPDGSAAAIRRRVGKGQVVAMGAHPELPQENWETAPPPPGCEVYLKLLLGLSSP